MNNSELAHRWANQSKESGRGANMFYRGPRIFSYGEHFLIAELVTDKAGGEHVFYTRRTWGNATSKHLGHVRGALSGLNRRVWNVTGGDLRAGSDFFNHAENVRAFLEDMETARTQALRARRHADMYQEQAQRAAVDAGEYAALFGVAPLKGAAARKLKQQAAAALELARDGALFSAHEIDGIAARMAAAKEAAREADKRRAAAQAGKDAESAAQLEQWAAGAPGVQAPHIYGAATRLRLKDGRIETSRGAQITERAARRLWAALVRGVNVAGVELDGYTVNRWNGAALVVGCHTIPRGELVKMSEVLGLPGVLPITPDPVGMGWDETMARPDAGGI